MANELYRAFSKTEVQMSKKKYEKMITIPGHKGNENQNIKIPPHSCYNGYHQEHKQHKLMRMQKEPSYTVGGNVR
jgi:hypothetical protein